MGSMTYVGSIVLKETLNSTSRCICLLFTQLRAVFLITALVAVLYVLHLASNLF